ncbi:hypothetical protein H7849_01505 [Alloacidobacterium dinghuense]|uniref:DUF4386 domain-containing protein n=1 Tax=Alloacidobacterium dinghuense TaxID=2763107 RepID=A0A7G8BJJ9_9BACT|nr:hypothetical protein [Alloacidobacterium dinghuense]QNI32719.1 hypothetical protein H7849_01505 [Alloacidobacterium dinghuense]
MSGKRHTSLSLLLLTIVYVLLLFAGGSKLSAAFHIPHDSSAVSFMAKNSWAIKWGSFCELISALSLGIFMAACVSRLRLLGIRAVGVQIASFGGIGTTTMLTFSALTSWSLTRPGVAEASGAVTALQALTFDGGGPGFAVFLGLFIVGVSVVAGLNKQIPHWLMWLGIVVATSCELASLTVLTFTAGYFIPVGRFISIVWMIGISLKLPGSTADKWSKDPYRTSMQATEA